MLPRVLILNSGAGKSTLLDLMSFRKRALDGGEARLNGHRLNAASMSDVSSFVEQDDDRELPPDSEATIADTLTRLRCSYSP